MEDGVVALGENTGGKTGEGMVQDAYDVGHTLVGDGAVAGNTEGQMLVGEGLVEENDGG